MSVKTLKLSLLQCNIQLTSYWKLRLFEVNILEARFIQLSKKGETDKHGRKQTFLSSDAY